MADYVKLRTHVTTHVRFLEAGAVARDLYVWGMAWSGCQETDGEIPMAALLVSPWGAGGKRNVVVADKLVTVGLWERTDTGYRICKWAEQGNMTKAGLEEKRKAERERKARQRNSSFPIPVEPCPGGTPTVVPEARPASAGSSTFNSLSGSGSQGEMQEGVPPVWFQQAVSTVQDSTGEVLRIGDSWLRYFGHRRNKGIAPNQQDAVYWLTTVMIPEARKERRAESDKRDRDAKFDRERAAKNGETPAPYHAVVRTKPPKDAEPAASPEQAAAAAKKIAGMFR